MTIEQVAFELYRDDHHDGKVWSDLTSVFQEIYIDAATELLEEDE